MRCGSRYDTPTTKSTLMMWSRITTTALFYLYARDLRALHDDIQPVLHSWHHTPIQLWMGHFSFDFRHHNSLPSKKSCWVRATHTFKVKNHKKNHSMNCPFQSLPVQKVRGTAVRKRSWRHSTGFVLPGISLKMSFYSSPRCHTSCGCSGGNSDETHTSLNVWLFYSQTNFSPFDSIFKLAGGSRKSIRRLSLLLFQHIYMAYDSCVQGQPHNVLRFACIGPFPGIVSLRGHGRQV